MPKETLTFEQVKNFCVIDQLPIPIERVKRHATTCSKECAKKLRKQRMMLMEQTECKYCRRPSTPEEREAFRRFRKLEASHPDAVYPMKPEHSRAALDALKRICNENGHVWIDEVIKKIEPDWKSRWDVLKEENAREEELARLENDEEGVEISVKW